MDPAHLAAAERDLLAWGYLERADAGEPAWSRRFRGAVLRAAARLAEEERAGRKPPGHPLENAVRGALTELPPPAGAAWSATHEKLLVAVELAALPEAVRAFWSR